MSVTSGGTAPKGCRAGGSWSAEAGSAGISMIFSAAHDPLERYQVQTEAERSAVDTTTPANP